MDSTNWNASNMHKWSSSRLHLHKTHTAAHPSYSITCRGTAAWGWNLQRLREASWSQQPLEELANLNYVAFHWRHLPSNSETSLQPWYLRRFLAAWIPKVTSATTPPLLMYGFQVSCVYSCGLLISMGTAQSWLLSLIILTPYTRIWDYCPKSKFWKAQDIASFFFSHVTLVLLVLQWCIPASLWK